MSSIDWKLGDIMNVYLDQRLLCLGDGLAAWVSSAAIDAFGPVALATRLREVRNTTPPPHYYVRSLGLVETAEATRDVERGQLVTTKDVRPVQFTTNAPKWSEDAERLAADIDRLVREQMDAARLHPRLGSRCAMTPLEPAEVAPAVPPRRHNTTCPRCNGPAYQGLGAVRCEREGGCLADAEPTEVVPYMVGAERQYQAWGQGPGRGFSCSRPTAAFAIAAWRKAVLDRAWGRR